MRRVLLVAVAALCALGCRDLSRFDTDEDEAYCGSVVGAAFVREGFPPDLRLRLRLDTDNLSTVPGTVSTDDVAGVCDEPLFAETKLRAIPEVQNDPLALLEFGDGREHNFMAWADSSCRGSVLTVVSLMKNDDVELRLLQPGAETPTETQPAPGFALFQLTRRRGTCGF